MEDEKITAIWARETATGILGQTAASQLKNCLKFIKGAVENNKFSTGLNIYAQDPVVKELQRRGFKVKVTDDQREGSYTEITW